MPACDVFATASLQTVAAGLGTWQNRTFTQPRIKWGSYASSRSSSSFCTIPSHEINILWVFPELEFTIYSQISCISRYSYCTIWHFGIYQRVMLFWCLSFQELPALYLKEEERAAQDSVKELVLQQQGFFGINLIFLSSSYNMQYFVYNLWKLAYT